MAGCAIPVLQVELENLALVMWKCGQQFFAKKAVTDSQPDLKKAMPLVTGASLFCCKAARYRMHGKMELSRPGMLCQTSHLHRTPVI